MKRAVLYLHGKGGSAAEAERFQGACPDFDVLGVDYQGELPWEVMEPIAAAYAGGDNLISRQTVERFAAEHGAGLTVLENGEHWFHTEEQLAFLDDWLKKALSCRS